MMGNPLKIHPYLCIVWSLQNGSFYYPCFPWPGRPFVLATWIHSRKVHPDTEDKDLGDLQGQKYVDDIGRWCLQANVLRHCAETRWKYEITTAEQACIPFWLSLALHPSFDFFTQAFDQKNRFGCKYLHLPLPPATGQSSQTTFWLRHPIGLLARRHFHPLTKT